MQRLLIVGVARRLPRCPCCTTPTHGAQVDRVLSISETISGPGPRPMAGGVRMAMAEAVPVEPGQQSLDVVVHVVWSLR